MGVHQAHMYEDAAHCEHHYQSREERFTHSATKMGSTVIAGAVTTAGSGCFMFLCQPGSFYKMAVLIVITIMFSFIYLWVSSCLCVWSLALKVLLAIYRNCSAQRKRIIRPCGGVKASRQVRILLVFIFIAGWDTCVCY